MKGQEVLAAHVPELQEGRGPLIVGIILAAFSAASAALLAVDRLGPAWSGAGQVLALSLGFLWSAQFYWRRREYQARWGSLAYRNAFARHMLLGVPVMFAAIAHTPYLPGEPIRFGWAAPLVWLAGLYLALTGALLYVRSYGVFGVDRLAALYVYFPAEGRLVNSSIYGILRHPAYSGLVRIGLALGLWGGTWLSLPVGLFMPIGLTLWLRLVEEPELIERFGARYAEYRKSVPAFWPRARDASAFLKFLIAGEA